MNEKTTLQDIAKKMSEAFRLEINPQNVVEIPEEESKNEKINENEEKEKYNIFATRYDEYVLLAYMYTETNELIFVRVV